MSEAREHVESTATLGIASRPPWEKLIMTVLLTALIGPLIGTAICFIAASLSPELSIVFLLGSLPSGMIVNAVEGESIWVLILLGYVAGGIQATMCGLLFAIHGWSFGRLPVWVAVAAALFLALAFNFAFFGLALFTMAFSVAIHIVPALATWWLVRKYWQRTKA